MTLFGAQSMNLFSFLYWLWTVMSSWSMGLSLLAYLLLGITGISLFCLRHTKQKRPNWLPMTHSIIGWIMVGLVLFLFAIGLTSTLFLYGSVGQSEHLIAGLSVVCLVMLSAGSATQINPKRPWGRTVHVGINMVLLVGFAWVLFTGWKGLQKYSTLSRSRITKGEYSTEKRLESSSLLDQELDWLQVETLVGSLAPVIK